MQSGSSNGVAVRVEGKALLACVFALATTVLASGQGPRLAWDVFATLPDTPGVAGPFVGVDAGTLIVAGGANFPSPVWSSDKRWHDAVYVLALGGAPASWRVAGALPHGTAYGCSVSTRNGVLCIGGSDGRTVFRDVFVLRWSATEQSVTTSKWPNLPVPLVHGAAGRVGDTIYCVTGQRTSQLTSATRRVFALDLSARESNTEFAWRELEPFPGPARAFAVAAVQHDGYGDCLYVMSGRREVEGKVEFLEDVWCFAPRTGAWRRCADVPRCVMAGTAAPYGQSHILVLGGDDGALFGRADELRDEHPGFPRESLVYHTITDTWTSGGPTPINQVTTAAVPYGDSILVPSGEVRPRVRTPDVWRVRVASDQREFGLANFLVLSLYLLSVVGVGFYWARKTRSTDEYFRGGKHVPWWAAGCSIFATMLSSLTFTGIPSKTFAQDWVYSVGNAMIPLVAFVAVYLAMPFYRRIDATSAYEYFEKRFDRSVRWFASTCFSLFHVFRMAIVMSLTGLALSVATTLGPIESVLLIGALSVLYSTMGGVGAVIWTDTLQAVVLLCGAAIAFAMAVSGTDGGLHGFAHEGTIAGKFRIANTHWDASSTEVALWAIVVGAVGQNFSSYTADQAVVQRYLTTSSSKAAARAIWTNAVLTIPATLLFFGIGTALFTYYRSHPERLDPTVTTDQIFPMFIAREMPAGLAGLIVAGLFAAAQSTVSTSMNSSATVLVTDFLRPLRVCRSERGYLRAARLLTLGLGVCGTLIALLFVDPTIKSLFDAFLMTLGMFMGVLGGLFALGALTRRANGVGALVGALCGSATMFVLWRFTHVHGYLYTTIGIASCFSCGYAASCFVPSRAHDLAGLTVFDLRGREEGA
ncbi:MAG: sodium/solute symporter [Planctomycetes bacterium]|nr:sodium/solute symporter [Planctomycetota bacterium]MCB9918781.1 sodium/solute symporter [Planctomycetota bacterium]